MITNNQSKVFLAFQPFIANKILFLALLWHVVQVFFLVFNLSFGISPDEAYHVAVINFFAETFAWRLEDTSATLQYGMLSVVPYLYHRLLGFVSYFISDTEYSLLVLRLISSFFSIGFFIITAHICQKLTSNKTAQFLFLLILANIPKLQLLGAAVTYDNVINFLSALILLQIINFTSKPSLLSKLWIANVFMLGALVKITFVPWILVIAPIIIISLIKNKIAFQLSKTKTLIAIISFVLLGLLSADLHLRNLIEYKSIYPSADKVLGYEKAYNSYPQFRRNEIWRKEGAQEELMPTHVWFKKYLYMVSQSTLGIQGHKNYGRKIEHLNLYRLAWIPFLLGLVFLFIPSARRKFSSQVNLTILWVLLFAGLIYFLAAIHNNYSAYVNIFRTFGRGLQGRYLFPALPALLSIFAVIAICPTHKWLTRVFITFFMILFAGLGSLYIVCDPQIWVDHLKYGAVWKQNEIIKEELPKTAVETEVLIEQNKRNDGFAINDSTYFAQEIILSNNTSRIDFIELFLILGKTYQISLHNSENNLPGKVVSKLDYTPEQSGFAKIPLRLKENHQKLWLVAKGIDSNLIDLGTSSAESNPYSGRLISTKDKGKTWNTVNRDLYFKLLKIKNDSAYANDTILIGRGSYGDTRLIKREGEEVIALSSLMGQLVITKVKNQESKSWIFRNVFANWIAVNKVNDTEAILVVLSQKKRSLKVYHLDLENLFLKFEASFPIEADLAIDPSVIHINGDWLVTATSIIGTVNRKETNQQNGTYSINLFKSTNLKDWQKETTIIEAKRNLEDLTLYYSPKTKLLYLLFEEEELDGKASKLKILTYQDSTSSWSEPKIILDDGHDNEPAGIIETEQGFDIYFSSDKNNPGESYQGANAYVLKLDYNLNTIQAAKELKLEDRILLSDVIDDKDYNYYALLQDYNQERKLLLSKLPK